MNRIMATGAENGEAVASDEAARDFVATQRAHARHVQAR